MATLVTLKRFDGPSRESSSPASADVANGSELRASTSEQPRQDLEQVPVQPSVEQEKMAKLQYELENKQLKLAQILQSVSSELHAAKTKLANQMADMIADSALALLPTLLDDGFANELSVAAVQIGSAIEPDPITLKVHPNDHEPVIDALQNLASPHPVTVEKDSSLTSGSVHLSWPNGGAEIDKPALLNHAAGLLETKIASLLSGKNQDEY